MNKNYDLAVGAKRLEKVTPSLILRPISRKQRSARSQTIRVNILPTADIRL